MKFIRLTLCLVFFLNISASYAQTVIGLTETDMLFRINNATAPGIVSSPVAVSGITSGQVIAGIDFQPSTGILFALGYDTINGNSQLYTIDTATAVATLINATPFVLQLGTGSIGFDFNPVVDRIRVVGANGNNYRINPSVGILSATDLPLNYATGDPNFGTAPLITACAYSNSYIGTDTTTLYDIDQALNILAIQNPPNNGTLHTIGISGITIYLVNPTVDFDIYFDPATRTNIAYMSANRYLFMSDNLYKMDLSTGIISNQGPIGGAVPGVRVKDIALVIDRTIPPAVTGELVYALTKNNTNLISFDSNNPSVIRSYVPVTGITSGQVLGGIDFRPADRQLYGIGYNDLNDSYQIYIINPATGVATAVNAVPGNIVLTRGPVGFDFNPVVDRVRVTGINGNNYRINPDDGLIVATDVALNYAVGDISDGKTPYVGSIAYTSNFVGALSTTLYGLDDTRSTLVDINPPNAGVMHTLVSNILAFTASDQTSDIDFYYDSLSTTDKGYLAVNVNNSPNDTLYTITSAGVVSPIGSIGYGIAIKDIAVAFYTPSTVGLTSHVATENSINVFPNPVAEQLHVVLASANTKNRTLIVNDITGRNILQIEIPDGMEEVNLSVHNLANGVYTVSVQQDNMVSAVKKFIKR
jgi:trimeric autotransporter adhesin